MNIRAALVVALAMAVGGWLGGIGANRLAGPYLRLAFGAITTILGGSLIYGALRRLGWI